LFEEGFYYIAVCDARGDNITVLIKQGTEGKSKRVPKFTLSFVYGHYECRYY